MYSLFIASVPCVLIPIDVFAIRNSALLSVTWYGYVTLGILYLFTLFFISPFGFFYISQVEDDFEKEDVSEVDAYDYNSSSLKFRRSFCQRASVAACNTAGLFVVLSVLFLLGLFVQPSTVPSHDNPSLIHELSAVKASFIFLLGVLVVIGIHNVLFYTTVGVVSLPLSLLRAPENAIELKLRTKFQIKQLNLRRSSLESEESTDSIFLSRSKSKDHDLFLVKRQERNLQRNLTAMDELSDLSSSALLLYPLRFCSGLFCLTASALVIASLGVSAYDRLFISCGWNCGFSLHSSDIYTPLDTVLFYLNGFSPLSEIAVGFLGLYLVTCTFHGIVEQGVTILGLQVATIHPRGSWAQPLILSSAMIVLTMFSCYFLLVTMCPDFLGFGGIGEAERSHRSTVSGLANQMIVFMPLFSLLTLLGCILFCILCILHSLRYWISSYKRRIDHVTVSSSTTD